MSNHRLKKIVEDFHGTMVEDRYRWLENETEETQQWVKEQNNKTFRYIHAQPAYRQAKARIRELFDYAKYSVPVKAGRKLIYFKNKGLERQPLLMLAEPTKAQSGETAEPKVILDVNSLSEDGTVAITALFPDKKGELLAYYCATSGSDWQEIKIRDLKRNCDLPEEIKWVKFNRVSWSPDGKGFYYSRFPEPGTVEPEDQSNYNSVYYHQIGTRQEEDQLIYQDHANKELGFNPIVTEDGQYLLLAVYRGTSPKSSIYYRSLAGESAEQNKFIRLIDQMDAEYTFIGNQGEHFYFKTDLKAARGRIIVVDLAKPDRENWREVIPEQADILTNAQLINNRLVTVYMHHAAHWIKIYSLQGAFEQELDFPFPATVAGLTGKQNDDEMFFTLTSFLNPPQVYRYSFAGKELSKFQSVELEFPFDDYQIEQVFYPTKDGTTIPMFLVYQKGMELDGENPLLLYGYGGFNISITPAFYPSALFWLENGGVYAVANLRGGGEYGEEWHQAGMLENKQNVFDDFIAAAEWLIKKGYTSQEHLAISGRSNGGLLVAACMVQRPELYSAVICGVPVIDMLRYHKFTVGRYWIPEYGNAEDNPEHFNFLYQYSPLHNIRKGVPYPAVIIGTGDTDDRVVPLHARKFAAALQEASTGENPILLRVDQKAGHGLGKPLDKLIEEEVDFYSFILTRVSGKSL